MKIDKILTDNPIMDNIVYYLKILGSESIYKDPVEADKNETVDTMKESGIYISSLENNSVFASYVYPYELLLKFYPESVAKQFAANNDKIPVKDRPKITEAARLKYIQDYEDKNAYYRALSGLPPTGDPGIYLDDRKSITGEYVMEDRRLDLSDEELDIIKTEVDIDKPIHKMTEMELQVLIDRNILQTLQMLYPEKKYLNYLGEKRIGVYQSRKADRFALLRAPSSVKIPDLVSKWKTKYETNRIYTLKTVYSDAFKYQSDYYDNFIQIFIIIQTMADIISELPEFMIRKEFFDIRSVQYMFESYGVDFFPEIPFNYQLLMIKNLNQLLKFKSTTRNIVDICSLFGFKNIKIFKYYLLKDRTITKNDITGEEEFTFAYKIRQKYNPLTEQMEDEYDGNGNPIYATDDDGNYIYDLDQMHSLQFIKVPIDGIADDYIRDESSYTPYYDIVDSDPYWNGLEEKEVVKQKILEREFNIYRTKYLSIDAIYDMSKLSFELCYFFNIIFSPHVKINLVLDVPCINQEGKTKLTHAIFFLYYLAYRRQGIKDNIMDTMGKILSVKGFNLTADMESLAEYLHSESLTFEDVGIAGTNEDGLPYEFMTNIKTIATPEYLIGIYLNNTKIYNHIAKMMRIAPNRRIYSIYRNIWEALMIYDTNNEIFKLPDGTIAKTFTEYFGYYNPNIYNKIIDLEAYPEEDQNGMIADYISNIIDDLEIYLDTSEFEYMFRNIPNLSSELVKEYIYKVIGFYKSYKVDFTSINTVYIFNDRMENIITTLEYIKQLLSTMTIKIPKEEIMIDKIKAILSEMIIREDYRDFDGLKRRIKDVMYELAYCYEYQDYINIRDIIYQILVITEWPEYGNPYQFKDWFDMEITKKYGDKVSCFDHAYVSTVYE